jgi:iron transport multicopper oxidase
MTAALIWDWQGGYLPVTPRTSYRFHIVNQGAFGFFHVWIEGHIMYVIEVDGVYVDPYPTMGINVAVGQRYSVMVYMDADPTRNFPIVAAMGQYTLLILLLIIDQTMFDHDAKNPNTTAWLVYNNSAPRPPANPVSQFPYFDDTNLNCIPSIPPSDYDRLVSIAVNFTVSNGLNLATINGVSYQAPQIPSLFTVLSSGLNAVNPSIYGNTTNTFVLNPLEMVWIVINNHDNGSHPCTIPYYNT